MPTSGNEKMPGRDKNPIAMNTLPTGETGGTELGKSNASGYQIGDSNDGVSLDTGYSEMGSARVGDDDGMKRPPSADQ